MDDPTPRSKKDRETECVTGGSCSQARAPILFALSGSNVLLVFDLRNPRSNLARPFNRQPKLSTI
jgi:hypothetical protein